jgi:pimeloyl-ACP methyl ester carboxylesterase
VNIKGLVTGAGRLAWWGTKKLDETFNAPPSRWERFTGSGQVLVFIHGLLSEGERAWSSKEADWIDLVAGDQQLADFDIFLAEWYSTLLSGETDLLKSADSLAHDLSRQVNGHRPVIEADHIVFICHSMGGLVARQALVRRPDIFGGKKVTILSFGTPAKGVSLAVRLERVAQAAGHHQVLTLKSGSPILMALHDDFAELIQRSEGRIRGAEYVESHLVAPRYKLVRLLDSHLIRPKPLVGMNSQGGYFGQPVLLNGTDHRSISRPDSITHPSHQALRSFLSKQLAAAQEEG